MKSQDGIELLHSSDLSFVEAERRQPGSYESICTFPPKFFNRSGYVVVVGADVPQDRVILPFEELVSFNVDELMYDQMVYSLAGKPKGALHPFLEWKVNSIHG